MHTNSITRSITSDLSRFSRLVRRLGLALAVSLLVVVVSHGANGARPGSEAVATTATAVPSVEVDTSELALVGFDPWYGLRYSAAKTANFAGCIFGVGVPIGLVWAFATNPAVWRFVLGMGAMPASYGGSASTYLTWVKNRCAYALR